MSHGEIVSFIWSIADLIRDSFRRGEYQNVILPLTVLRRLDCVLAPTAGSLANILKETPTWNLIYEDSTAVLFQKIK